MAMIAAQINALKRHPASSILAFCIWSQLGYYCALFLWAA